MAFGCIAVKQKQGSWAGIPCQEAARPTILGRALWKKIEQDGMEKVAADLLKHGEWQQFLNGGNCPYCGKAGASPVNVRGDIQVAVGSFKIGGIPEIELNIKKTGFPDPDCKYHSHALKVSPVTKETASPLEYPWIYILDPERNQIEVLAAQPAKPGTHSHYIHKSLIKLDLSAKREEPNWELMEDEIDKLWQAPEEPLEDDFENEVNFYCDRCDDEITEEEAARYDNLCLSCYEEQQGEEEEEEEEEEVKMPEPDTELDI